MAKKFIIEDDMFKISASIEYHKELATNKEKVVGGGWWHMSADEKTIYLYDESMDFGKVTIEQLREVKKNGLVSPRIESMKWIFSNTSSLDHAILFGEEV